MSEYILEMLNISKSFAGVQALKDVSIRCRPGRVYGLVWREWRRQVNPDEDPGRRLPG